MSKKIARKADVIQALNEGAFLYNNGTGHYTKCYIVWGSKHKWEKWTTVRYDTFYNLKDELDLVYERDGIAEIYRIKITEEGEQR